MIYEDEDDADGYDEIGNMFDAFSAEAQALTSRRDFPFDLRSTLVENPYLLVQGESDQAEEGGPLIGRTIVHNGPVYDIKGTLLSNALSVGVVISHSHGRVVAIIEQEDDAPVYLGWLHPDEFRVIDIHASDPPPWMH